MTEATNSPFGFRDAVRASRIGGGAAMRAFLTATPTRFGPRGEWAFKIKFVRRMGDDFPHAIDLVSSGRVKVRALVTHRES